MSKENYPLPPSPFNGALTMRRTGRICSTLGRFVLALAAWSSTSLAVGLLSITYPTGARTSKTARLCMSWAMSGSPGL